MKLNNNSLVEILLREAVQIPFGWKKEVYYNNKTDEISFSSLMTSNSWTDSDDKVGEIDNYDGNEGAKIINENWVEVDDMENETDPDFKEDYKRYYNESSIISMDDAIDRWASWGEDDGWYSEIRENIGSLNQ